MKKLILLFLSLFFVACSSGIDYISERNDVNIRIDGEYSDWQGILKPVNKEGFVAGFIKQNEKIFLCFVISDRNKINKILRNGSTVYLQNNYIESFGIKYPLINNLRNIRPDKELMNLGQPGKENISEEILDKIIESFTEFSIINKDEYPINTFMVDSKTNYKVKLKYKDYKLVYEIEINTSGLNLFDDINELKELKIGIVSTVPNIPRENRRPPEFENDDEDDRGMMTKNRQNGGGGIKRRENLEEMQKPFEFWFNVKFN